MNASRTITVLAVALTLCLGASASAQNLLKNPSFEQLRPAPNQFGHHFVDQDGWVYEAPGKLAVGNIAHTGERSYLIVNGKGGKTRYRTPGLKLEPGRYRFTAWLRGLSIVGTYNTAMDVHVLDGKFHPMKVPTNFAWTQLTHVVQLDKPVENSQIMIGLIGSGWLWVDDVSLEKVADSVEVTPAPVLGKEVAPIAPPTPLAGQTMRCGECGYRCSSDATTCYACGSALATRIVASGPPVKVLFDFEDGTPGAFAGGKITRQNVPQGQAGFEITDGWASNDKPQDWSGYDFLKIDVFNPHDDPVMFSVEVRDAETRDYWTRVNYVTVLPPGNSTVSLPTDIYVGEKSRPGRPLISSKITRLVFAPDKQPVVIDNVRLERLDVTPAQFDGLQAFDFGPPNGPVMPGYLAVTPSSIYSEGRGYGWEGTTTWTRAFDGFQPDALFQDFVLVADAQFRVDLPNGRYTVIMNIDSPGGYWGEVQHYTHRQVLVNDKVVVDEKMSIDEFQKFYFRYAATEDLPGLDTFEQYVQPMFNVKKFDIDVTDGKAVFSFKSDGNWGITLSALAIYPAGKAQEGQRFWEWTTQQRHNQFNDYFKQIVPKAVGAAAQQQGYVLFSRGLSPANAYDTPRPQDAIPAEGLSLTLAKGEEHPITFALHPDSQTGPIDIVLSEFTGPGGERLDPKSFQPGWIDYRISRVTMEGTVYTVAPRYWHPTPAPDAKVTRNFWIRTCVPENTAPGKYTGTITVKPASAQAQDIPVTITVLPFALDPVTDVAVGPWGCGITLPWAGNDPRTGQWNQAMFHKVLASLRQHGFNTVTGLPNIGVRAANGKVELDFTRADQEMQTLRQYGFDQMISSYGAQGLGYNMYGTASGPDEAAARSAGFPNAEAFLKALYGAIEEHAQSSNWLPIAWNLCDEPLGDAAQAAARNAALHAKVARDLNLKLQTFMGATSMTGNDPKDAHYNLVQSLPMPSLNLHDEASIQLIREKGNRFSFYNGGNRWTYGRYMKALVEKYGLAYRVSWHLNVTAGNPYYALDCREDDYCWYNTNQDQALVPSMSLLGNILPGLNDYRYLSTLQRLLTEKPNHPAFAQAKQVYDQQISLAAGKDRPGPRDEEDFNRDRQAVVNAILSLLNGQ